MNFPKRVRRSRSYLSQLGFTVDDQLEKLPAKSLGEKVFGLVKVPHSYYFDRPTGRRKQENDGLLGEPLLLLREQDGHLLAHSREGYLGYIRSDDVLALDEAAYVKYLAGPRVLVTSNQTDSTPKIPAGGG